MSRSNNLSYVEQKEFNALVAEISACGFSRTAEVSEYIRRNQLGQKYQHISGIVTMRSNGDQWRFVGGFPTHIYARLCEALGLGNNGSRAEVVGFTPFKKVYS